MCATASSAGSPALTTLASCATLKAPFPVAAHVRDAAIPPLRKIAA
jgi:hypothetical protein